MDLGDVTQLIFVATTALVVGRLGWSLARMIDRRALRPPASGGAEDRIVALEQEQLVLRQELAELQERQDFTERALIEQGRPAPGSPGALPDRIATPR